MSRLVLSLALVGAVGNRRAGAELSDTLGHGDRAVRGRRAGRHHRPHRRRHLLAARSASSSWSRTSAAPAAPPARRASRAPLPDGYTIGLGHIGTHAAAVALYPEPRLQAGSRFRADRADRDAAGAPHDPQGRSPPTTCKEFVAYAKANESKLNMGHAGVGSVSYIVLPAAQPRDRHQADAGAVHRHRARAERHARRTRSTTSAIRCSARCRMCAPAR